MISHVDALPNEVHFQILSYLPLDAQLCAAEAHPLWASIVSSPTYLRKTADTRYNAVHRKGETLRFHTLLSSTYICNYDCPAWRMAGSYKPSEECTRAYNCPAALNHIFFYSAFNPSESKTPFELRVERTPAEGGTIPYPKNMIKRSFSQIIIPTSHPFLDEPVLLDSKSESIFTICGATNLPFRFKLEKDLFLEPNVTVREIITEGLSRLKHSILWTNPDPIDGSKYSVMFALRPIGPPIYPLKVCLVTDGLAESSSPSSLFS